ncbi:hypothetical protein DYB35_003736 [Aphanomyces astaci]|uniref:Uncharacterized protein n=2 Tax=Aphanomyces astaci TaxID=112090 RepID=A0A418D838_APHAT|nr:hypothetical protein DYB35_003736 [Aphanomyces astaci]
MNSFATTIHVASRQDLTPVLPLYKKWLPSSHLTLISQWAKVAKVALGVFCTFLLVVDVSSNNWELIDYVGDAKHLLTPLLAIDSVDTMQDRFTFCDGGAPSDMSQIGQFHINISLAQIQARDSNTFILGTTKHLIQDRANDICGQIVQSYPIKDPTAKSVRLGTVDDGITFARGTALTHWLGNTLSSPQATDGMNETQLRALGYVPARHSTDLRLMTPLVLPPPGQVTAGSVSMYRFFMKAFCSGCVPGTELGLDTCAIEYLYNDTTNTLEITSSQAILGGSHELGFIFQRRGGPILALYIRFATLLLLIGVYSASQKTVQWLDYAGQSLPQRLVRLISPPLYRQPCSVFGLSDICFNSDIFVVLYTLMVLLDEEISMVFSGEIHTWHDHTSDDILVDIRLMSIHLRWLWLNCFLLKAAKWTVNFVSLTRFSGDNTIMGWLNYSSVAWIYLGVFVLFQRNDIINRNNADKVELLSTTQSLDATFVRLFDSWYVRAMPTLALALVTNLVVWLLVDRAVNWHWWQAFAHNSMARQLMFNSTSILAVVRGDVSTVQTRGASGQGTRITIKARALCTFHWFFSSHLTHFGLVEHPSAMRGMASNAAIAPKPSSVAAKRQRAMSKPSKRSSVGVPREASAGWLAVQEEPVKRNSADSIDTSDPEQYMLVQDRDGQVHLINDQKLGLKALSVEVKILRDTTFCLG